MPPSEAGRGGIFSRSIGGNKVFGCELDSRMIAVLAQSQAALVSNLTMATTGGPPYPPPPQYPSHPTLPQPPLSVSANTHIHRQCALSVYIQRTVAGSNDQYDQCVFQSPARYCDMFSDDVFSELFCFLAVELLSSVKAVWHLNDGSCSCCCLLSQRKLKCN